MDQTIRSQLRQDALSAWKHYQTTGLHLKEEEADVWLRKLEGAKTAEASEEITKRLVKRVAGTGRYTHP